LPLVPSVVVIVVTVVVVLVIEVVVAKLICGTSIAVTVTVTPDVPLLRALCNFAVIEAGVSAAILAATFETLAPCGTMML